MLPKTLVTMLLLVAGEILANAQWIVSGTLQSIPNALPQVIGFTAPVNNAIISYDGNGNLVINYNSINPRDGDGEVQRVVVKLSENGNDLFVTDTDKDGTILIPEIN